MSKGERRNDVENYLACSVPHKSEGAAREELEAFMNGIGELRRKHRMANVLVAVQMNVKTPDGPAGTVQTHGSFGDDSMALLMAALTYGAEKRCHEILLAKALGEEE